MKERPILFSAPMVRALLAGTKTQTRRIVTPQPPPVVRAIYRPFAEHPNNWQGYGADLIEWYGRCPYGLSGDRLWVKETWRAPTSCDHLPPRSIYDTEPLRFVADEFIGADAGFGKARPSIFMPRWASRISLEVTEVRVERLQDISKADAIAEGLHQTRDGSAWQVDAEGRHYAANPIDSYASLWTSINGAGSWDADPWVWVVEFKRI